MQKAEFLQILHDKLQAAGMHPDHIVRSLNDLSDYFDTLSHEALMKEINECSDPERLAQVLLAKHAVKREAPSSAHSEATASTGPVLTPIESDETDPDATRAIHTPIEGENSEQTDEDATVKIDVVPRSARSPHSGNTAEQRVTPAQPAHTASQVPTPYRSRAIKYADLDRVMAVDPKNRIIFWCVFVLLIPLLLALFLVLLGSFLFLFLAMAAVIVGCIGVLVGIVGVGTGISLFGLIYGTTQLFSTMAAGLYEIGIAVTVAGGSLCSGIILYNTAIRLMPFLMKYLYVFFCFILKKCYQLFRFIRRECTGR